MSSTILVTGANRGLGLEFCRQYLNNGDKVIAVHRSAPSPELEQLNNTAAGQLTILKADVTNATDLTNLAQQLQGASIDLLINNAGIHGTRVAFGKAEEDDWLNVFRTNTIAPMMVVQHLRPSLAPSAKIALLSSKMGSVADNTSGGSYTYRSSKAALNAVGKSLAIDLGKEGIAVAICHPGWVRTDMGGPNALIDTETSVNGLRLVIENLDLNNSGQFFNYDGTSISW